MVGEEEPTEEEWKGARCSKCNAPIVVIQARNLVDHSADPEPIEVVQESGPVATAYRIHVCPPDPDAASESES